MSDKETIVNGIDVSECQDFYLTSSKGEVSLRCNCDCDNTKSLFCSDNQDCYFKQLARKTQEYEELKQKSISLLKKASKLNHNLALNKCRLEQECEELKEENQKLEMQLCNNCGERDDYNIPCKMIRDLDYGLQKEIEENDRYRKALEEIEKICLEDTRTFADGTQVRYDSLDEILDIINKAKGGR